MSFTPPRLPLRRQTGGGSTPLQRTPTRRPTGVPSASLSRPRVATVTKTTRTTPRPPHIRPRDLDGALMSPRPTAALSTFLNDQGEEAIQVAVRVRPFNAKESGNHRLTWKVLKGESRVELTTVDGSDLPRNARDQSSFDFDKTFGEEATNRDVYDGSVLNIVKSVCAGLNGTVFAYGQTSSGKTFTMQGSGTIQQGSDGDTGAGIVHMAADDIFRHIEAQPDRLFVVTASFLEVYNEDVRDLLADDANAKSLPVREDKKGRGFFVNCREEPVTGKASLLSILARGEKTRSFAATAMNERSSRSHTILRVTIESRGKPNDDDGVEADESVIASTLTLVDLAGSESVRHTGATGERQTEGANINKSLLSLTLVMKALGDPRTQHVNYRDSNLTRILQPSLSGNARMAIVFCVSPSELYLEETRSTLKFATRAKKVKTRPKVNKILDDKSKIKALERELEAARLDLVNAGGVNVRDLERQVEMRSKEAVVNREKMSRLMSIILNLNHGIFQTGGVRAPSSSVTTLDAAAKRRLSVGATPSGATTKGCDEKPLVPATVPRPDKKRKGAPQDPLPHAVQLNLFQEALTSKSDALDVEREKRKEVEQSLNAVTLRAEGAELELDTAKAEASRLAAQLSSLRPVLEKAFVDQQADQSKLQDLQVKYDAEAKERQILQQSLEEARKRGEELEAQNTELSNSLERETVRFKEETTEFKGQFESLRRAHEEAQRELESLRDDLTKSREENQRTLEQNATLEEAKALCERQLSEIVSINTSLEEKNKAVQELRAQETQAFADEKAGLASQFSALSEAKLALEDDCKRLHGELSTLSASNKTLESCVEALQSEKSSLESTISQKEVALTAQMEEIEAMRNRLEETAESASSSVAALESTVQGKEAEISSLRTALEKAEVENKSLQHKLLDSESRCTSLSLEKDSINSELEEKSSRLSRASDINEKQREQIESLHSSVAELESREALALSSLQVTKAERDESVDGLSLMKSELERLSGDKETLRMECESLRQRLVSSEEQQAQLTNDYTSVQECLSSSKAALENTTQAMLSHQTSCETLRQQVATLTKENNRLSDEVSESMSTLERMKEEMACRQKMEESEKERFLSQHAEGVNALEVQLTDASHELKSAHDALCNLRLQFDDLQQRNNALESALQDGSQRELSLSQKCDELQQLQESTKNEVVRLQSAAAASVGHVEKADKERSAFVQEIQCLNSTVGDLTKSKIDLQDQVSSLRREMDQLTSSSQIDRQALLDQTRELETAMKLRAALEAELGRTSKEKEEVASQLAEIVERINSFEDLTKRLHAEIDEQKIQNRSIASTLSESESRVGALNETIVVLQREKADGENVALQLQQQVQKSLLDIHQLKEDLIESRAERDGFKHELVRSHDMLETAKAQLNVKQASINELQDQIASMRNMLHERDPSQEHASIVQSHGDESNESTSLVEKEDESANDSECELKLLLSRANDTIEEARQREFQYVREIEMLRAQYESAAAQLCEAELVSNASLDLEKLRLENRDLESRLQTEAAARATSEAKLEQRLHDVKRNLIHDAGVSMSNLQTDLRKAKDRIKQLEAEAYAGRQDNQDIRERCSSAYAKVAALENTNERLQGAIDEAIRNHTSEVDRLSKEAKAAKEAEYATKQTIRDLEKKFRDCLDANVKLTAETKGCKLLRERIESLECQLEALTNSGSLRDDTVAQLVDKLRIKDERIAWLEQKKFKKEHAVMLKNIKESNARMTREIEQLQQQLESEQLRHQLESEQLRQQLDSFTPAAGESSDTTKLRFDKDALETKFRKLASRCQELEEEKEVCLTVLRRHLNNADDANLVSAVAKVCDRLTSDVNPRMSSHSDGIAMGREQLVDTVERQRAELRSLHATILSLQSEIEHRCKTVRSDHIVLGLQKQVSELETKVHHLELENLNLINERTTLRDKYHQGLRELNRLRTRTADDTTMDLQKLKKHHQSSKRSNVSHSESQASSKRVKSQELLISSKAQSALSDTPARKKNLTSKISTEPHHSRTPMTARDPKVHTSKTPSNFPNDENAGNGVPYTLDNITESIRKSKPRHHDPGLNLPAESLALLHPKLGESHPTTDNNESKPECTQS